LTNWKGFKMNTPKKARNTPRKSANTPNQGDQAGQAPVTWLRFEVSFAPSSSDEQVVLVGSHSWLGNWDWKQQKKLIQDKSNSSQWRLSLACPENPVDYHYRYRVVTKSDNKTLAESTIMHLRPMTDQWVGSSLDTVVTLPHEWKTCSRHSSIGPHVALATPTRDLKNSASSLADEAEACADELQAEISMLQAALARKQAVADGGDVSSENNAAEVNEINELRETNKSLREELENEKTARAADLENHSKQHQELQVLTDAAMDDHKHTEDRHERECAELRTLVGQLEKEHAQNGAKSKEEMNAELLKARQNGEAELDVLRANHATALAALQEEKDQLEVRLAEVKSELEDRVCELEQSVADAKGMYNRVLQALPDSVGWVVGQAEATNPTIASLERMGGAVEQAAIAAFTQAKHKHDTKVEELASSLAEEVMERKGLQETVHQLKGNIRVIARVRPLSQNEQTAGDISCVQAGTGDKKLTLMPVANDGKTSNPKAFVFDKVFGGDSTQSQVFSEVQGMVSSVLDGYNACIFAYGQTGAGKTYTMGSKGGGGGDEGIIIRAVRHLYERAARLEETSASNTSTDEKATVVQKVVMKMRMVEIYNESVKDLLCGAEGGEREGEIRANGNGGVSLRRDASSGQMIVEGSTLVSVASEEQVLAVMDEGSKRRATSSTAMNAESSRSHLVLTLVAEVYEERTNSVEHTEQVIRVMTSRSALNLVDLAGSERLSKSKVEGQQATEAKMINKSLSSLGDVFQALQTKSTHVPFRNSKLTHLLSDMLSGGAKVLMIVQISPATKSAGESSCSLTWAQRVASVELGAAVKSVQAASSSAAADTRETQMLKSRNDELQRSNKELQAASKKFEQQLQQLKQQSQKDEQLQQKKEVQQKEKEQRLVQQLQQQKDRQQKREQQLKENQAAKPARKQPAKQPVEEKAAKTPTKRCASMPKIKPRTEGRPTPRTPTSTKKDKSKQSSFKADAENRPHGHNISSISSANCDPEKKMELAQARTELRAVYEKWCPEKLANGGVSIDSLLSKWEGREALLIEKVTAKYAKMETPALPLSPRKQARAEAAMTPLPLTPNRA
jgi:hypothetical protein